MWSLVQSLPPAHPAVRCRIVVNDVFTRAFWPLQLSDHISFGHAADLLDYWDCPMSEYENKKWPERFESGQMVTDLLSTGLNPESWLLLNFLKKRQVEPAFTLPDWWQLLAQMFVIVDNTSLDLFWPKYDVHIERKYGDDYDFHPLQLLGLADWLLLNTGTRPAAQFSKILEHDLNAMTPEQLQSLMM